MRNRAKRGIVLERCYVWLTFKHRILLREKEVRTNVKHCKNPCRAPEKEFQKVVLKYWRRFGLKPEKYWFDWFGQGENHYNKYFIPDNIWYEKITPYFNNLMFKRAIADKGMFDILIPEVKQPRTVVKNRAGIFYDGKGNVITKKEALTLCIQEEKFIAKPTLGGGAGKDIHFYDKTRDTKEKIEKIFSFYQNNFIVQEIVEQHEILSNLNESSLNSMRVLSIFFQNEVHILSAILRMGQKGSMVDNVSAGGIQCGIHMDGTLYEKGSDKYGNWISRHPNGFLFKEIKIPSYDRVLETIKKNHKYLPYFKIIGWDFAIDREGEPVLIEFNVSPEQNQLTCGPTFAKLTDQILEEVFVKKTLKGSAD